MEYTMLYSDTDLSLSSTTRPLFEISDIYVALESKRSTSSLADWRSSNRGQNKNCYEKAFVPGGKDDVLKAVIINSDLVMQDLLIDGDSPIIKVNDDFLEERKDSKRRTGTCCSNCSNTETTLWRRIAGHLMCNPCALYFKLHGCHRPRELLKTEIKRRRRRSQNNIYTSSNIE